MLRNLSACNFFEILFTLLSINDMKLLFAILVLIVSGCNGFKQVGTVMPTMAIFAPSVFQFVNDTILPLHRPQQTTTPDALMEFAETQIGVPYVYASCDPKVGFDCSGFITYVFSHFNIPVPRSSYEFTHLGNTIAFNEAKRGDVILFTGTDSLSNSVGHIGLVTYHGGGVLNFIHATSGKEMAVTVTTFGAKYKKRFVRVCRIL